MTKNTINAFAVCLAVASVGAALYLASASTPKTFYKVAGCGFAGMCSHEAIWWKDRGTKQSVR